MPHWSSPINGLETAVADRVVKKNLMSWLHRRLCRLSVVPRHHRASGPGGRPHRCEALRDLREAMWGAELKTLRDAGGFDG